MALCDGSLAHLREVLYEGDTTLDVVVDEYKAWVGRDQYLVFEQDRFHSPLRQVASLVAKRGNSKYAWRVRKRWKEFILPFEYQHRLDVEGGFFQSDKAVTNVLYCTLTWDVNFCDWKTAWDSVSFFWNSFVSCLRRRFDCHILTCRTWESSGRGFPHVHCILYFPDREFSTFLKWSRKEKRDVWRIPYSAVGKIQGCWHSHVDVQGMPYMAEGLQYLCKYISKSTNIEGKALNSLACAWAFRKRSYSLGSKFKESIFARYLEYDLTRNSLTQTFSEQLTLSGEVLRDCQPDFLKPFFEKWRIRGIVDKSSLKRHGGIPRGCFSFGLCDSQKEFVAWYFEKND